MSKNNKDLPAQSDINPDKDHTRNHQQEEYDNRGKDALQKESEVRNTQKSEQMRDSQQGDERMIPDSKAKGSEKDHNENRKFPNLKK